jgi:hypothetical protein
MNLAASIVAIALGLVAIGVAHALPAHAPSAAQPADSNPDEPEPVRAVKDYNLPRKSTLAIKGYDPVAYFPEGARKPVKGLDSIEHTYKCVTYRFASTDNLERFKKDPARYEPTYGGWCAWAMLNGDKVDVDPRKFIVKDGRLFLFYNGFLNDTRAKWLDRDHDEQTAKADEQWKTLTKEEARKPKGPQDDPEEAHLQ